MKKRAFIKSLFTGLLAAPVAIQAAPKLTFTSREYERDNLLAHNNLADVIYDISPIDTPFTQSVSSSGAPPEWVEDELRPVMKSRTVRTHIDMPRS